MYKWLVSLMSPFYRLLRCTVLYAACPVLCIQNVFTAVAISRIVHVPVYGTELYKFLYTLVSVHASTYLTTGFGLTFYCLKKQTACVCSNLWGPRGSCEFSEVYVLYYLVSSTTHVQHLSPHLPPLTHHINSLTSLYLNRLTC